MFKNKISIVNFLFSWQMTMGQWPTMRFVPSWRSNKIFLKKWKIGVDLKWWDILKPLFDKFALLTGLTSLMLRLMCSLVCPTSMATGQYQQMWVYSCYKSILQFAFINHSSLTSHYSILHFRWIQESNDMIDAIDEASSDEEFDEDDLTNGATG